MYKKKTKAKRVFLVVQFCRQIDSVIVGISIRYWPNNRLMYVNWKFLVASPGRTMRRVFYGTNHRHSTPVLSRPFRLPDWIQFRKKAARTNSASVGMVKLRNFSSRSDVSDHSRERRTAFTRILLCCLDTYISRLIVTITCGRRKERSS